MKGMKRGVTTMMRRRTSSLGRRTLLGGCPLLPYITPSLSSM
jgi:hypothetical protein